MTISSVSVSSAQEQQLVLSNISWEQYQTLLETFADYSGLKLIYYHGTLEFYMPSAEHEKIKKIIARLLERYAEEMEIDLYAYGSTTFRNQAKASGLEPDECYCFSSWKEIPDLAIEINFTSGTIDKLEVYKALGIPEVLIWYNNELKLYRLNNENYTEVKRSQFLPDLDWQILANHIFPQAQSQAIKDFIQKVRSLNS